MEILVAAVLQMVEPFLLLRGVLILGLLRISWIIDDMEDSG
jgi:hypothetical protein